MFQDFPYSPPLCTYSEIFEENHLLGRTTQTVDLPLYSSYTSYFLHLEWKRPSDISRINDLNLNFNLKWLTCRLMPHNIWISSTDHLPKGTMVAYPGMTSFSSGLRLSSWELCWFNMANLNADTSPGMYIMSKLK